MAYTHHDALVVISELHGNSQRVVHEALVQTVQLVFVPARRVRRTRPCADAHKVLLHHFHQVPRIIGAVQKRLDLPDLRANLDME